MSLVVVIIILIVWGVIILKEKLTPPAPPIDDMEEHLKHLMSLPDEKARQKYLKNRNKRR